MSEIVARFARLTHQAYGDVGHMRMGNNGRQGARSRRRIPAHGGFASLDEARRARYCTPRRLRDCSTRPLSDAFDMVEQVKQVIEDDYGPEGYNVGFNHGAAAGRRSLISTFI